MRISLFIAIVAISCGLFVLAVAVAADYTSSDLDRSKVELKGDGWAVISEGTGTSSILDVDSSATRDDLDRMVGSEDVQREVRSGEISVLDMDDSDLVADAAPSVFRRLAGLRELRIGGPVIVDGAFADGVPFGGGSIGMGPDGTGGKPAIQPPQDDDAQLASVATIGNLEVLAVGRNVTDNGLGSLKALTHLRALHVGDAKRITGAGLSQLRGLRKLESLVLPSADLDDSGLENLKYFPQLIELSLGLRKCATWIPSRTPVKSKVTDAGMRHLRDLPNLRKLQLSGLGIAGNGLLSFGALTKLEALELDDLRGLTTTNEWDAEGLKTLRTLTIRNTMTSSAALKNLNALSKLEQLTLDNTRLDDNGVRDLAGLINLKRLHIVNQMEPAPHQPPEGVNGRIEFLLNGKGLSEAFRTMPVLQELVLDNCSVDDRVMPGVASLSQLRSLRLIRNSVTDYGLQYLEGLTQLESLDIGAPSFFFTDNAIGHLRGLTHLRKLDISGTEVSDTGIAELATLVELRQLSLPRNITDRGVERLGSLRKLEEVDVLGSKVTVVGLRFLRDHCPNLKTAKVKGAYLRNGELRVER